MKLQEFKDMPEDEYKTICEDFEKKLEEISDKREETWQSRFELFKGVTAIIWMNQLLSKATEHILKDGGFHLELDIDMESPVAKWKFSIAPKSHEDEPNQE